VAAITILIVDVPSGRLSRRQSELCIGFSALNFASGTYGEQKDGSTNLRCLTRTPDIKKLVDREKNFSHQELSADQFIYTASQTLFTHFAIPARIVRDFHNGKSSLHGNRP
jgi:hypothetical protein